MSVNLGLRTRTRTDFLNNYEKIRIFFPSLFARTKFGEIKKIFYGSDRIGHWILLFFGQTTFRIILILEILRKRFKFIRVRVIQLQIQTSDDAKLVIHAHEKTLSVHIRKYNVPEASELDTLVVRKQDGNLDIVLRCCSEFDVDGY